MPSDLCFDRLHILLAFHVYQGGSLPGGFLERLGVDRQFWLTLFGLEGLRFGLIFLLTMNCLVFLLLQCGFSFRVYKV